MRARITVIGLLLCLGAAVPPGRAATDPGAGAAFDRLKTLVGEWRNDDGTETVTYELIAGGSALLERDTAADRPAMVTLYHRDGDRLVLTHYCMAGNQPRMVARPFDPAGAELAFDFLDATNLPQPGAGHMHSAKIRFVDANQIESEWQFLDGGKVTMTERTRYTRVR